MPVSIQKTKKGFRVSTPGGVKAKHTTKDKAKKQKRLLNAVDHGWKPTGKKSRHESAALIVSTLLERQR
jgi:phage gp16-like protein